MYSLTWPVVLVPKSLPLTGACSLYRQRPAKWHRNSEFNIIGVCSASSLLLSKEGPKGQGTRERNLCNIFEKVFILCCTAKFSRTWLGGPTGPRFRRKGRKKRKRKVGARFYQEESRRVWAQWDWSWLDGTLLGWFSTAPDSPVLFPGVTKTDLSERNETFFLSFSPSPARRDTRTSFVKNFTWNSTTILNTVLCKVRLQKKFPSFCNNVLSKDLLSFELLLQKSTTWL